MVLLLAALAIFFTDDAIAQGNGKNKDKYEYDNHDHEHKGDKHKHKGYHKNGKYKKGDHHNNYDHATRTPRPVDVVLGKVLFPRAGTAGPRQLAGVPRGHYPPPGSCRVWYPNRPPGHQPAPTNCENLRNVRLAPGAFILHGGRAYDAQYDWRQEERRRPGTVGRDIIDILFPSRR